MDVNPVGSEGHRREDSNVMGCSGAGRVRPEELTPRLPLKVC